MKDSLEDIQKRGFGKIDKYICPKCAGSKFAKSWIKTNAKTKTTCSYCGAKTNCLHME